MYGFKETYGCHGRGLFLQGLRMGFRKMKEGLTYLLREEPWELVQ